MSHIETIETEVRDATAVHAACERLRLPPPLQGAHELFSGTIEGLAVRLPQWEYAAICELQTGKLHYDNYGGRWGDEKEIGRFLQAYAAEKSKIAARCKGHSVTEQQLPDGWLKVSIQVGGAA